MRCWDPGLELMEIIKSKIQHKMSKKYTIIIPTRNRLEYLPYAINSVLDSERDDFELIISDNLSSDGTGEFLVGLKDSRVRIVMPEVVLPMAGHYEFALNQAKGEWITILGDDDAVMPYFFERLDHYIEKNPVIDVISSARAYYFWPGCEDIYGNNVMIYESDERCSVRSLEKDMMSVLNGVRSCFDIPQIYTTSVVKRSLYNEIKMRSGGCFYHSIIPDMYSAVAIWMARKEYLRVEEPLFWVGTSSKSMSRSDRIYQDAKAFHEINRDQYPCVPREISDCISYVIHSSSFSSVYLFECLLSSPLKSERHQSRLVRMRVLASVLADLRRQRRKEEEAKQIVDAVISECAKYSLSMAVICFFSTICRFQMGLAIVQQLISSRMRRFYSAKNIKNLYSNNRNAFPSIREASVAVQKVKMEIK